EEGRKTVARRHLAGTDELRHGHRLDRRLVGVDLTRTGVGEGEHAVGRAEVDADDVAAVGHGTLRDLDLRGREQLRVLPPARRDVGAPYPPAGVPEDAAEGRRAADVAGEPDRDRV